MFRLPEGNRSNIDEFLARLETGEGTNGGMARAYTIFTLRKAMSSKILRPNLDRHN